MHSLHAKRLHETAIMPSHVRLEWS